MVEHKLLAPDIADPGWLQNLQLIGCSWYRAVCFGNCCQHQLRGYMKGVALQRWAMSTFNLEINLTNALWQGMCIITRSS